MCPIKIYSLSSPVLIDGNGKIYDSKDSERPSYKNCRIYLDNILHKTSPDWVKLNSAKYSDSLHRVNVPVPMIMVFLLFGQFKVRCGFQCQKHALIFILRIPTSPEFLYCIFHMTFDGIRYPDMLFICMINHNEVVYTNTKNTIAYTSTKL